MLDTYIGDTNKESFMSRSYQINVIIFERFTRDFYMLLLVSSFLGLKIH